MKRLNALTIGIYFIVISITLLVGCKNESPVDGGDIILDTFIGDIKSSYFISSVPNKEKPLTIKIVKPLELSVESDSEWLNFETELKDSFSIKLLPDENYGEESRTAVLTLRSGNVKEPMEIKVTQDKPVDRSLTIEGIDWPLEPSGEERIIKIYSKTSPWEIEFIEPCSWVKFDKTEGEATGESFAEVKMTVQKNSTGIKRTAKFFIHGNETQNCELSQDLFVNAPPQVGDKGLKFDKSRIDGRYAYVINEWIKAGVKGGIPTLKEEYELRNELPVKGFRPGKNVFAEIQTYLNVSGNKKKIIYLHNGEYECNTALTLKSNTLLVGESKDGVIIKVKGTGKIYFKDSENSALKNVTLKGAWYNYTPVDNNFQNIWGDNYRHRMVDLQGSYNCYVDNVRIINSKSHPLYITSYTGGKTRYGSYNTIRNVTVDGAYNKGSGCAGYFMIQGNHNLITKCKVTNVRHISMQDDVSKYNVLFRNDFEQEVSFHNNDGGNNLIEQNNITIPNNMGGYYAIMGPWSSMHKIGKKNFIYKNKCREWNHNGKTPWSDNHLYMGPLEKILGDTPKRYEAFRRLWDFQDPKGGTFYPVVVPK